MVIPKKPDKWTSGAFVCHRNLKIPYLLPLDVFFQAGNAPKLFLVGAPQWTPLVDLSLQCKLLHGYSRQLAHLYLFLFLFLTRYVRSIWHYCKYILTTDRPITNLLILKILNGHISGSRRGYPIQIMFGSRVEFSGSANRMVLFPVWPNSRWREPPSWKIQMAISNLLKDLKGLLCRR